MTAFSARASTGCLAADALVYTHEHKFVSVRDLKTGVRLDPALFVIGRPPTPTNKAE